MAKLKIPVKGNTEFIEFDTDDENSLPSEMYLEALAQGLKVLVHKNMAKIKKGDFASPEEYAAEVLAVAKANAKAINENNQKVIKLSGAPKAKKASAAVNAEAMRLARTVVKDELKKAGIKVGSIKASEITAFAKKVLASDAGEAIMKQAEETIAARAEPTASVSASSIFGEAFLASAEKVQPKKPPTLSAKQAGKTAKAKPKGQPQVQANA